MKTRRLSSLTRALLAAVLCLLPLSARAQDTDRTDPSMTNMGLTEVSSGAPGTIDTTELGDMNPNVAASWAVNPSSSHIAVTRVEGVTSVLSMPSGGTISGQAAFINLAGSSPREMAVVPQAALVVNFPALGGGGGFAAFLQAQQGITQDALTQRDRRVEE